MNYAYENVPMCAALDIRAALELVSVIPKCLPQMGLSIY